jgi:hypothetical protein
MATITRTQSFVRVEADMLLAVEGKGTVKWQKSGAPDLARVKTIGAVFSGDVRITRLASGEGYNFLRVGVQRGSDRRRVFFRGDARVSFGGQDMTVERLYNLLDGMERMDAVLRRFGL